MGTRSNAEQFKEALLTDFIMAAGPPASISSRMGLSSAVRAAATGAARRRGGRGGSGRCRRARPLRTWPRRRATGSGTRSQSRCSRHCRRGWGWPARCRSRRRGGDPASGWTMRRQRAWSTRCRRGFCRRWPMRQTRRAAPAGASLSSSM
jgi:hypothetical protein